MGGNPYNNFFLSFISQFIYLFLLLFFYLDFFFYCLKFLSVLLLQVRKGVIDMEFSFIASRLKTRPQRGVILIP